MHHYQNNQLLIEDIKLSDLAAEYGTPSYIYSQTTLENNWHAFNNAFENQPHRICYAVKANPNLSILKCLAKLNSGFDIVSVGELERVLMAGGDPKKIIFSGVGKQTHEIERALDVGIFCFNVESEQELVRINDCAKNKNIIASIALRINPNIDAGTHPYIATGLFTNKFGIAHEDLPKILATLPSFNHLKLIGMGCHIGSQILDLKPFAEALDFLNEYSKNLPLSFLNVGGGLGVRYQNEDAPTISDYVTLIRNKFKNFQGEIILEPGRAIVANAGLLLTKIEYIKKTPHKNFIIVDAAMNDLIRPALYQAWHDIIPVNLENKSPVSSYDIVGPVCETADFLGRERSFAVDAGDLLAICSAGAYGASMNSNYNSRPRCAEILVKNNISTLIRKRENIEDLYRLEQSC